MRTIVTILTGLALATLGFYFYVIIDGYRHAPKGMAPQATVQQTAATESAASKLGPEEQALFEKGQSLFKTNCGSCHALNQKRIGPALAGVSEKYAGEEDWLYSWIRNSPGMINDGDPKAVALWEEYNKQSMTAFPSFTDEDIDAVLKYIEVES